MRSLKYNSSTNYKININDFDFPKVLLDKYFIEAGKRKDILNFTGRELLHAIMTCGMPSFYLSAPISLKRKNELMYKFYLIETALEVDTDDYIVVSDRIKYLDASEKVFISYYIGMFITKLVSSKIFNFDYLVHLGIVEKYKSVKRDSEEPDLVGFNKSDNRYVVFESKGRQKIKNSLIIKAKNQIQSIKYISGAKPEFGVVCVSHPIKEGKRVSCNMYDPEVSNENISDITRADLLYLYYLPIYELIKEYEVDSIGNKDTIKYNIMLNDNVRNVEIFLTISKRIIDFYTENDSFEKWNKSKEKSKLQEIVSELGINRNGDLVMVEME